jgi:hypothetical protein
MEAASIVDRRELDKVKVAHSLDDFPRVVNSVGVEADARHSNWKG